MKKVKFVFFGLLLMLIVFGMNSVIAAPGITKTADIQMTYSGLTVISYGGYLNGESFQQDGILTYNGYQYTCFWNTSRRVILARRQLPSGTWNKIEISTYTNTIDDAHNTISLGICPNDGTLHVAFDHHGSDLHYIRSVTGLVTNPGGVAWETASFQPWTSYLGGTKVTLVTYPRFITTPNGGMLFEYRYGTSGSGDQMLWEYNNGSWTNLGKYIDGISDSINAYPHGLEYQGSRLHMTWCYRATPDASTNFDLYYIYSDDNGRTWRNNAGASVGVTGSTFIRSNSSGIRVWTISQNRGLINQEHMTVDNAGRVHVLLSHMPDSQPDDSNFTSARTKSQFFHYWRNTNGTWTRTAMNFPVILNFRGKFAVASNSDLYAVLPDLRIASASASSNWTDWTMVNTQDSGRFFSDPLIDRNRLKLEDKLTIYYPQKNSPNIYTLDYNLNPGSSVTPAPTPTPTPTSIPGTYYKIRNRATNMNIDGYGRTADGSNCSQYANSSSYNQQWLIEAAGSYVKIKNRATGLYLDGMGRTSNGSICGQWSSSTSNNQQWTQETAGSYLKYRNRATGLYIDGAGLTTNGADLKQYGSSSSNNQQWSLVTP